MLELFLPKNATLMGRLKKPLEQTASSTLGTRSQVTESLFISGEGNPASSLVFIEMQNSFEDELKVASSQLLVKMIEALGLKKTEVFIAVLTQSQSSGQVPLTQFLSRTSPVIVALGEECAHSLLSTTLPFDELRGKFADYRNLILMPTFHPSTLLKKPSAKREAWEDLKQVAAMLGIEIPRR